MRIPALACCAALVLALARAGEAPKPTGLTETVEKRLVQLDVAVEGDRDAIRALTAKDFTLYVGGRWIRDLTVDRFCGDEPTSASTPPPLASQPPLPAPPAVRPKATYVFFFDQTHLTTAGRKLALETARDLVPRLIHGGNRASIVSNDKSLETVVPSTDDPIKLLDGLGRLEADTRQWSSYSELEEQRAQEVWDEALSMAIRRKGSAPRDIRGLPLEKDTPEHAAQTGTPLPSPCRIKTARRYAREELIEAERSTERLSNTLGALAEVAAPKALIYFGDTLRQRAGQHYFQLACPGSAEEMSAAQVPSASPAFDAAIEEALARGVHFFTVQAEGLLTYWPGWDAERHRAAQEALVALAAETGGEAFLGGASRELIASTIEARTSCILLLSFPPGELPRDKPLEVTLGLKAPNVKVRSQARIVVPSPASIERARLRAAFIDPASSDDGSLHVQLVPRGGDGKSWKIAVQLRLHPTGFPDNSAELGASLVRREKVEAHFASSIATQSGQRAMVLEKSLDIGPGDFTIVAVAREATRGDIGSRRLDASWPNPARLEAAIAPIAALQTGAAAMSKDGAVSSSGLIAHDPGDPLDPRADIVFESVACRGLGTKGPVVVTRSISDGPADEFTSMTIGEAGEPCRRILDVVHPGRLQPGASEYRVTVSAGERLLAEERRAVRVGERNQP